MKKFILIFCLVLFALAETFAETTRFYEKEKVIDTMYVNSDSGLKVRDYPSRKSNRLCGLSYRFPVKVVAIGKEDTIDGITAPWVEILIPRYEWKGEKAEYGWVFGGYLSSEPPAFEVPRNSAEVKAYLENNYWHFNWEMGGDAFIEDGLFVDGNLVILDEDNYAVSHYDEAVDFFTIKNANVISFGLEYSKKYRNMSEKITLLPKGTVKFNFADGYFFPDDWRKFCNNDYLWDFFATLTFPKMMGKYLFKDKRCYAIYDGKKTLINYYAENKFSDSSILETAIQAGISAKNTAFEKNYHDYWNPIMAEHQKNADSLR